MGNVFWIATVAMCAFALLLVLRPLAAERGPFARQVVAVALLLPTLSVALYGLLGQPHAAMSQGQPERTSGPQRGAVSTNAARPQVGSVASMVDGLAARLEREPDDAGGWLLLAKSYHHLGRDDDARSAYAKAEALGKTDPAFAALIDGDNAAASSGSSAAATGVAVAIRGRVSVDPELAARIPSTATVFIFAKAVNGPPMPIAVLKKTVSQLPVEFVLDDGSSMMQGTPLSSADRVVVTARISASGNALQTADSYEASVGPIAVRDAGFVELKITDSNDN